MRKILQVALREYLETAKTRVFLVSIFMTPLLILGVLAATRGLTKKVTEGEWQPKTIAVADYSGRLGERMDIAISRHNNTTPKRQFQLLLLDKAKLDASTIETIHEEARANVLKGQWPAALIIDPAVFDGGKDSKIYVKGGRLEDNELASRTQSFLQNAVADVRLQELGLSPEIVAASRVPVPVTLEDLTAGGQSKSARMVSMFRPFFFLMLMFMGIFGTSQGMLTSVIEEKNTRVAEVLLSAVSPFELMAGKILGLACLGLTILLLWGGAANGAAIWRGMGDMLLGPAMGWFLIFFILGFILYASFFASVGAACNTLKEAQALVTPLTFIVIIPMVCWMYITNYPDSALSLTLSLFPLTAPMVMILRLAARPDLPIWQILASLLLLTASVPLMMIGAGKIFRIGILMYGKPPTLVELARWIRQP